MRWGLFRLAGATAVLSVLTACGSFSDADRWWDDLEAESPCYRVNLLDGLDESSTDEVDELFRCVNAHGHLEPLEPTADAFSVRTRTGDPIGVEIAVAVNAMPDVDVDPFALFGVMGDAMQAEDKPINEITDLVLEAIYGVPGPKVRSGAVPLDDAQVLRGGLLVPLGEVLPVAAGAMLDDDLRAAVWASELIGGAETKRWVRTLSSYATSKDPKVHGPVRALVPQMGEMLAAAQSPGNDQWQGARGDSMRDLIVYMSSADFDIEAQGLEIANDPVFRTQFEARLVQMHADGTLQGVAADIKWLSTVDVDGNPVQPGEDSALHAFVRLLARTNHPVDCEVLWIPFNIGNLGVAILELMADMDPADVDTGLELLGDVFDIPILGDLATELASGACPDLDRQVMSDLDAINQISRPEAEDLLTAFVELMNVLKYGQSNHIPAFADVAEEVYFAGVIPPAEELIRDVGDEPALATVVELVPVLSNPSAHGIDADGDPAVTLQDALGLVSWVWEADKDGLDGWDRMEPLWMPLVRQDGLWSTLHNAGALMRNRESQLAQIVDLFPTLLDLDPDLVLLDQMGPLLASDTIGYPVVRLLESELSARIFAADTSPGQDEVPLAFLGRLMTDGTLDDLLRLIDVILGDTKK